MSHKFKYSDRDRLISEERKKSLPPKDVLISLGLKKGDTVADIGSGIGYFTFPAAEIVGKSGKVVAMDLLEEMLKDIEEKVRGLGIENIYTLKVDESDLILKSDIIDFAFCCNVLHEVHDLGRTLSDIKRILKKNGRLAVIDWIKGNTKKGPPLEHRLEPIEIIYWLRRLGFKDIGQRDLNDSLYSITAVLE